MPKVAPLPPKPCKVVPPPPKPISRNASPPVDPEVEVFRVHEEPIRKQRKARAEWLQWLKREEEAARMEEVARVEEEQFQARSGEDSDSNNDVMSLRLNREKMAKKLFRGILPSAFPGPGPGHLQSAAGSSRSATCAMPAFAGTGAAPPPLPPPLPAPPLPPQAPLALFTPPAAAPATGPSDVKSIQGRNCANRSTEAGEEPWTQRQAALGCNAPQDAIDGETQLGQRWRSFRRDLGTRRKMEGQGISYILNPEPRSNESVQLRDVLLDALLARDLSALKRASDALASCPSPSMFLVPLPLRPSFGNPARVGSSAARQLTKAPVHLDGGTIVPGVRPEASTAPRNYVIPPIHAPDPIPNHTTIELDSEEDRLEQDLTELLVSDMMVASEELDPDSMFDTDHNNLLNIQDMLDADTDDEESTSIKGNTMKFEINWDCLQPNLFVDTGLLQLL
ncbi:hypothetical protein B0H17DRAFT_1202880 [Mycena rosella]|uniref:Uncharacterized protein n=1 Tax=Mycena rosella TaxID=1033263 RepID=A0AAD7GCV2_MYCRO|nr:hypothetical protein B0H17DRAFT_1202880 [Mycena rosella]